VRDERARTETVSTAYHITHISTVLIVMVIVVGGSTNRGGVSVCACKSIYF